MIETISDFLSVFIMGLIAIYCVIYFYHISIKHREANMKSIESRYYRYYEGLDDGGDEDENEPYYED